MIGETINGFLIQDKIAVASTGTIYCAKDTKLEVLKVIKILNPSLVKNEIVRRRFHVALQAWAKLDYPTFVPIYSVIEEPDILGYVMNFVEGKSVAEHIKEQGKLGISQAVDYILQVAKALAVAHEAQTIHRKLSCNNILICKDESVKIVGLGALKGIKAEKVTPSNLCIGKPQYMAPEQFAGNYSPQTDQYTLGIIFYEMITGKLPFVNQNLRTLYQMHLQQKPVPPKEINPDIEPEIEEIILKMLAKKPEHRFSDMKALIGKLLMSTDRLDSAGDLSVQSLMYRGRHAMERRRLESAIYFFNKVLSIYGKETPYYEEALQRRQEASDLFQEDESIHAIRDFFTEALVSFDEDNLTETRESVIKILRIMQSYPNSSRLRGIRMDIAREIPDILAEASNWLDEEIQQSKLLTSKAEELLEEGQYEEGIDLFSQALEHDPKNQQAFYGRTSAQKKRKIALVARCYCNAQAALKKGDYNQAVSLFEKVLQLDSGHENAHKYLEMTKKEQEELKRRHKEIDEYYREGLELYEKWQYTEALEKFQRVLQLDPCHAEAGNFITLARLRLDEDSKIEELGLFYKNGVVFYQNRKWREAIACFSRVLKDISTHKKAMEYKKLATEALNFEEFWNQTFNEAVGFFNASKYAEALAKLDQLSQYDAQNSEIVRYQRLCRELMESGPIS